MTTQWGNARILWLADFLQDVRFGLRMLRKSPGYTFTAIVALGLGIGANTALFTLFSGLVSRPLAVPEPDRVVKALKAPNNANFTYEEYLYYRDHSMAFEALSATLRTTLRMSSERTAPLPTTSGIGIERLQGSTEPVMAVFVSSNYFSMMGVSPTAGRRFQQDDDRIVAPSYAAMLSENFWERRFGSDGSILGKDLMFIGIPAVVVGITPRDFTGSRFEAPDVWLPLAARQLDRTAPCCGIEGRLKPGVSLQQAQAELALITNALHEDFAGAGQARRVSLDTPKPGLGGDNIYYIYGLLLQPAIGMVLLIACANVAGLLLGKAAARQKEIAVRLSIGASRGRVVRQMLTEGVLTAQLAGFISLLVTWWILAVAVRVILPTLERYDLSNGGSLVVNVTPDLKVVFYALAVSVLTGIVFALLPALQASRPNLAATLKEEVAALGGKGKSRLQGWMVATQIAVCLMLLIGAGTLVSSSARLLITDPGFDRAHLLSLSISNPASLGYSESRIEALNQYLLSRLPGLPGVRSIASASRMPLGGGPPTIVAPEGNQNTDPEAQLRAPRYPFTFVSAEYFETLGIPLLQGRGFTQQEISSRAAVAIISDALAKQLWPGQSAIGKRITVGSRTPQLFAPSPFFASMDIVGVVRDVYSHSMIAPDRGALYLPRQEAEWNENLFIRTREDANALVGPLSAELRSIDQNLSATIQTMGSVIQNDHGFIVVRVFSIVFSLIGLLGLLLASVGIYSMVGYTVSRQTREVGIRMALGAQKVDVLRLVIGRCMRPIAAGITTGITLGVILSLLISSQSPGLTLLEPWRLAGISLFLTTIALTAAYLPTRKAMNLDPSVALRSH